MLDTDTIKLIKELCASVETANTRIVQLESELRVLKDGGSVDPVPRTRAPLTEPRAHRPLYVQALERLSSSEAFITISGKVGKEERARMFFAKHILAGDPLATAERKAVNTVNGMF